MILNKWNLGKFYKESNTNAFIAITDVTRAELRLQMYIFFLILTHF